MLKLLKTMDGNYSGAEHTYAYSTLLYSQNNSIQHAERYRLPDRLCKELKNMPDPFGDDAYRKSVFFDNYSRLVYHDFASDGSRFDCEARKEDWSDLVIRVMEGLFTHYIYNLSKKNLDIDMSYINEYAEQMTKAMYRMEWLPPGRGLFAMGTEHAFKTGSSALNNCYAISTEHNFVLAMSWAMSMLLHGGGVGSDLMWRGEIHHPNKDDYFTFVIPDTREGWVCSLELLLRSYIPIDGVITNKFPNFDYKLIRPYGEVIKGFGGTSSGPEPLRVLLESTELYLDAFMEYKRLEITPDNIHEKGDLQVNFYLDMFNKMVEKRLYKQNDTDIIDCIKTHAKDKYLPMNHTQLIMNIFNLIGKCVHSGNIRRSAEIVLGDTNDLTFMDMKNWMYYPNRREFMHNSNNSLRINNRSDREKFIPLVVERLKTNGEPGLIFNDFVQKYGRMGEEEYGPDKATLTNPCSELSLESYEPCCLAVVCPSLCVDSNNQVDPEKIMKATEYATFYATTVVCCIPHEWEITNEIITRNRRIGVSCCGVADFYEKYGKDYTCVVLDRMYKEVRKVNTKLCEFWNVNRSIRVTCIKPEGTLGIITALSPGCHFSIMRQGCRRIGVDDSSKVLKLVRSAGYKIEKSTLAENSSYIMFPLKLDKAGRTRNEVSLEEQIDLAIICQKYFADNAVSFTLEFKTSDLDRLESLITKASEELKCISAFPALDTTTCQYKHLPFQPLNDEDFQELKKNITPVNWTTILYPNRLDAVDLNEDVASGCNGEYCVRPRK